MEAGEILLTTRRQTGEDLGGGDGSTEEIEAAAEA
jgi:hypothetical protein